VPGHDLVDDRFARPIARHTRRIRAASLLAPAGTIERIPVMTRIPFLSVFARRIRTDERGAATAEYAIATMAAVGFASLLVVIMQSDEVRGILTDLVRNALTVGG
jgi:Flp pilus assembly pilin Flp